MSAHAALLDAFPRRPLALDQSEQDKAAKTLRLGWIIVLLLFLPGLFWGWTLWQDQQLRTHLRANGVEAEVVRAEGNCWSRRQISGDEPKGCNLDISYQVAPQHGGGVREADVWLDGRSPVLQPPALYDPDDPSRVMLKPEAERDLRWTEWIGAPIALLFPIGGLLLLLFGTKGGLEEALRNPRPVSLPIDRLVRRNNGLEVWFRWPEGGKERLQLFANGSEPLLLNPPSGDPDGPPWALALLDAKGRPILLRRDLSEIDLTAEERSRLLG
jgi:hypothetical protein